MKQKQPGLPDFCHSASGQLWRHRVFSQQLRIACQGVFADWQDVIKKHLILDGVGEEKARETALLIISLMEGALIISLTNQDKQPLLTAAEYLSVVTKNAKQIQ